MKGKRNTYIAMSERKPSTEQVILALVEILNKLCELMVNSRALILLTMFLKS